MQCYLHFKQCVFKCIIPLLYTSHLDSFYELRDESLLFFWVRQCNVIIWSVFLINSCRQLRPQEVLWRGGTEGSVCRKREVGLQSSGCGCQRLHWGGGAKVRSGCMVLYSCQLSANEMICTRAINLFYSRVVWPVCRAGVSFCLYCCLLLASRAERGQERSPFALIDSIYLLWQHPCSLLFIISTWLSIIGQQQGSAGLPDWE